MKWIRGLPDVLDIPFPSHCFLLFSNLDMDRVELDLPILLDVLIAIDIFSLLVDLRANFIG